MSKQGVNPNAKPFVPSFLQSSPQQAAPAPRNLSSFAPAYQPQQQYLPRDHQQQAQTSSLPPPFHHAPPPFIPGGGVGGYVAGRPLYPGLSGAPPAYVPPPSLTQTQQPRSSYDQLLKSRGTPDSKVLSPARDALFPSEGPCAAAVKAPEPIALLFLGPRGSGKSTQAAKAAAKFNLLAVSAGDLIRQRKQPFIELRKLVDEHFGPSAACRKYNGVALDRFIVNGEADVYYLQWALTNVFGIPRVFLLMLDWETALARADAREEEQRHKSTQRRLMEYRAHFDACENIFAPIGCLDRIDCEGHDVEAVHALIMQRVDKHLAERKLNLSASALPVPYFFKDVLTMRMVADVAKFTQVKHDVHKALGTIALDVAPVSSMSGVIDQQVLVDPKLRRSLSSYFVTLKADGQRLVVVKHKAFGVIGFPQKFTCAYDCTPLFAAIEWPTPPDVAAATDDAPVEMILDCEIIQTPGKVQPTVYVFDFIYFYGIKAVNQRFGLRLEALREFFGKLVFPENAPRVLQLKEYVPAGQLRNLLPDLSAAPFAVDGVVFQPDSCYKYGMDKFLFKWKPQSKCTVDFRLYGCQEPSKAGDPYVFEGKVQEVAKSTDPDHRVQVEEVTYPGILIHIPADVVVKEQLSDGGIVECVKRVPKSAAPAKGTAAPSKKEHHSKSSESPAVEIWDFYKNRADKLVPNRSDIADKVSKMEHLTYTVLLSLCDSFK